jgi:hypothetical protein
MKKLAVVELPLQGSSPIKGRAQYVSKKILKRDEYVSTTNKHSMTTAMLSVTPFFRSAITRLRKPYSMIFHER